MATFSTWAALRTAIKDAIANHIAGAPCVGAYTTPAGQTVRYRTYEELTDLLARTYELEAIEQTGQRSTMVSYGRYRRFR
jgi:hypothetical protein